LKQLLQTEENTTRC